MVNASQFGRSGIATCENWPMLRRCPTPQAGSSRGSRWVPMPTRHQARPRSSRPLCGRYSLTKGHRYSPTTRIRRAMTLIIGMFSPDGIFQSSDHRLSASHRPVDHEADKHLAYIGSSGRALLAFTGLAKH